MNVLHRLLLSVTLLSATSTMLASCAVASYSRCGLTSEQSYRNWHQVWGTTDPVVHPRNDAELASTVATAYAAGCRVRPVGTMHSYDGLVAQKAEVDTVVVSLALYTPPPAWDNVVNAATPSVRMGAGRTFLDLMQLVRYRGYLMVTQTTGPFFSLAGVFFSPSVHGSAFDADRLASLVVGLRAMLSNGTSVAITDPAQVRCRPTGRRAPSQRWRLVADCHPRATTVAPSWRARRGCMNLSV